MGGHRPRNGDAAATGEGAGALLDWGPPICCREQAAPQGPAAPIMARLSSPRYAGTTGTARPKALGRASTPFLAAARTDRD